MSRWFSAFWVGVAVILSLVVVAFGYPAFQSRFGYPASLLWTLACVGGVWLTYFIRAWAFGARDHDERS